METDRTTGFDFTNTKTYNLQPRWSAYLKTTDNPSTKDYIAFISGQKSDYLLARGITDGRIHNQDDFTEFIELLRNK